MGIQDILNAHQCITPYIHITPVLTCKSFNDILKKTLFFKCENFQKTGSFKARGATHALLSLHKHSVKTGVATHSSGNHAAALSWAAKQRQTNAHIVMPESAPKSKIEAVRHYGGKIVFCRPTLKAREETLNQIVAKTEADFIHPYDNAAIICGQGTAALEFLNSFSLDAIVVPVGGGGLASGTAIAVSALSPKTKIYGAEPKNADDAFRSVRDGRLYQIENPDTIADGLRTSLSNLTFSIIAQTVDDILLTSEEQIRKTTHLVWQRMKIIIEPSAAVPLAALFDNISRIPEKKIGIIFSGGNIDLNGFRLFRTKN